MTMRAVEGGIVIPAGGSVTLAPDGFHIMFITLKDTLKEGGKLPVTLNFVGAYSMEVGPTPATGRADRIVNLQGPEHYRAWQVPNLYSPPTT